jgi:hypothetical protein
MKSCFVEQSCLNIVNMIFESTCIGPCILIMQLMCFEHECALYESFFNVTSCPIRPLEFDKRNSYCTSCIILIEVPVYY